jgi:hypothetical protein
VKKFEIAFWDDEDGTRLFADARDQFTVAPGKLQLRFKLRAC